jgi:hypothetical protein
LSAVTRKISFSMGMRWDYIGYMGLHWATLALYGLALVLEGD